jgi:hypothetical protein
MTKAKKPIHDDSQIEEIDLTQIDAAHIDLPIHSDCSCILTSAFKSPEVSQSSVQLDLLHLFNNQREKPPEQTRIFPT